MKASGKLERLLELLENLGIEVRAERLDGSGGGLCSVRGRRVFFLDLDADSSTHEELAIAALAELPEVDGTYLPPTVRERIEGVRRSAGPQV